MALGPRVVVIGGGRVAMDVAGSALRLGSRSTLVALEQRDAMPAPAEALQEVLDEGALLIDGTMVTHVDQGSDAITLQCVRVELAPDAPAGIVRPTELTGTDFAITADTVILAIGQDPELADWASPLRVSNAAVEVDGEFRTSRPGVFAAGDAAGSQRFVATAVGDGMRAAESVARYLDLPRTLGDDAASGASEAREVSFSDINTFYFPRIAREERGTVDAEVRKVDFREIRLRYSAGQAQTEAERCFSCGACVECDNCFVFCPDMAIVRESSSALHYRVLDQYCKGCGCCLEECPCGAMSTREETK
jgi:NADPH-dependent glutamate synthase beta subunit-like oxidoreductase